MSTDQFESTLRDYLRRKPFQPFVVELINGERIAVKRPQLAIGGGSASFLTPADDLIEFACENVHTIQAAHFEAAS